jgi:hypothetical protein
MNRTAVSELLANAREQYDMAITHDRDNRLADAEDRRFLAGEQWTDAAKRARAGRPTLVINRLPQFVKQVVGDMRQNKPEIRALPVDDHSDPKLAEVYGAIIRHIESKSKAHRIYVKAAESAVSGGIGWFYITTGYVDQNSFDQDILVKLVRNPLSVVIDPDAVEMDRADMSYAFISELVSRKKFELQYPKVSLSGFDVAGPEASLTNWRSGDNIRIAQYWTRLADGNSTLALLGDGTTVDITDLPHNDVAGLDIKQTRDMPRFKVKWRRITGTDVIDEGDWAGSTIPLVPVIGEEIELGDRTVRHGLIRFAKDPQMSYNYFRSGAVEHIGMQPKAPIIGTAGQIGPYKEMWDNLNTGNPAYLLYAPDPMAPGKPERMAPPTTPAAMYQEAQVADADMKATTGIYDASLGNKSNETSGIAINARDHQGETSTYVYTDNLNAAIERAGEIMMEIIPKIYTSERSIRMIDEDGSIASYARVNKMLTDGTVLNDLGVGQYDIEVTTGPAYATKRQQAADAMVQFIKGIPPEQAGLITDLIAKSLDFPNAQKIAARLQYTLPPGIDPEADRAKQEAKQAQQQPDPQQQAQQAQQQQMQQMAVMLDMAHKKAITDKAMADARKADADADLAESNAGLAKVAALNELGQLTGTRSSEIEHAAHQMLFQIGHDHGMMGEGAQPEMPPMAQPQDDPSQGDPSQGQPDAPQAPPQGQTPMPGQPPQA